MKKTTESCALFSSGIINASQLNHEVSAEEFCRALSTQIVSIEKTHKHPHPTTTKTKNKTFVLCNY